MDFAPKLWSGPGHYGAAGVRVGVEDTLDSFSCLRLDMRLLQVTMRFDLFVVTIVGAALSARRACEARAIVHVFPSFNIYR